MEAPEKIYIHPNIGGREFLRPWLHRAANSESVEYIRTDAFIEKVVNFMEKIDNVDEYTWYNEEEHAVGITEKCIEDFKKYIKR